MGGEELSFDGLGLCALGLPPRGRGRGINNRRNKRKIRITPAWAGKSGCSAPRAGPATDYPRVGGEELTQRTLDRLDAGLPPRGRGRVWTPGRGRGRGGITPAWAGKRRGSQARGALGRDYPRVGGEERAGVDAKGVVGGLPPRGRGRANTTAHNRQNIRITPAWAGKRLCRILGLMRLRDYPRVGGEEALIRSGIVSIRGLPPRGRGRVGDYGRFYG